jgi:hypothetical protein
MSSVDNRAFFGISFADFNCFNSKSDKITDSIATNVIDLRIAVIL